MIKIILILKAIFIFCFLVKSSLTHAETRPECNIDQNRAKPFTTTYHEVKKVIQVLCSEATKTYSTNDIDRITAASILTAKQESIKVLKQYAWYVTPWFEQIWIERSGNKKLSYPGKKYVYINAAKKGFFKNGSITAREISLVDLNRCNIEIKECKEKFKALEYLLNKMLLPLKLEKLKIVQQHVIELDASWNRFVTNARSQTFLDIWATTWLYEKPSSFDELLNPPPTVQLFLFHPSIIIENVSAGIDGEQLKEGLAVGIIGVNWWDKSTSICGIPCGASITTTYSDRPGVKDAGIGLMFHLNNKYSFGFSQHSDDTGYYVSVDLLKFFEDQKSQLDAWKNQ